MRTTVGDIAERAGVSRQTASGILNNKGHLFTEETRVRVLKACQEAGYRPNAIAKALRSGKFGTVGLMSARASWLGHISPLALRTLEERLDTEGLRLLAGFFREVEEPRMLRESLTDGIIVNYAAGIPQSLLQALHESGLPVVWLNCDRADDAARPDDFAAGELAARHLMALGHRHIAWVNLYHDRENLDPSKHHYSALARIQGYENAMTVNGLSPHTILRPEGSSAKDAMATPFPWLETNKRPTAVIFHHACGLGTLLHQCGRLGLSIPNDLSVISISDGLPPGEGFPIDYIEIPHAELGRAIAEMAIEKIRQPDARLPCRILAPVFHACGSTGPCRAGTG